MPYNDQHCVAGMRLADGMSKAAVAFLAKQLAAENTHSGNFAFVVDMLQNYFFLCTAASYQQDMTVSQLV